MKRLTRNTMAALAISAMTLTGAAGGALLLSVDVAVAKNDKGNNGNGNGNGGGRGNGGGKDRADKGGGGNGKGNAKSSSGGGRDFAASGANKPNRGKAAGKQNGRGAQQASGPAARTPVDAFRNAANDIGRLFGKKPKKAKSSKPAKQLAVAATPKPKKNNGRGDLASELKGLNAAHASATARANAAPNSQVGRIETYRASVDVLNMSKEDLDAARAELEELEGQAGRPSEDIEADISAAEDAARGYAEDLETLDTALKEALEAEESGETPEPSSTEIQAEIDEVTDLAEANEETQAELAEELETANAYEAEVAEQEGEVARLEDELDAAELETGEALLEASKGRVISIEALNELHRLLDLPPPGHPEVEPLPEETPEEGQDVVTQEDITPTPDQTAG